MELKWYWLAEQMGLVTNISAQYNDGFIHYQVSARTGDVFFTLFLALIPTLFLLGCLLRFLLVRRGHDRAGRILSRGGVCILLLYAVLLASGIGPYVQFYPQGSGFLDLSVLEHILSSLYCALLALVWFLGSRLGQYLAISCQKRRKVP